MVMAGEEKWWSPSGILKDMLLVKIVLPIAVLCIVAFLAFSGATG